MAWSLCFSQIAAFLVGHRLELPMVWVASPRWASWARLFHVQSSKDCRNYTFRWFQNSCRAMSCNYYGRHQRNRVLGNSTEPDHLIFWAPYARVRMNRRHQEHMSVSRKSVCRAWSYTSSKGPFATATHWPFFGMFSQNCIISVSKYHLVCHASHLFC